MTHQCVVQSEFSLKRYFHSHVYCTFKLYQKIQLHLRLYWYYVQYSDLMKKRKIVLNDKIKIAAVIAELDQKKNEALKKAWEQVNKVREYKNK